MQGKYKGNAKVRTYKGNAEGIQREMLRKYTENAKGIERKC